MDPGSWRGGSLKVLELLQDHPAEFAYDFRHKFQLSTEDIGEGITFREAALLTSMLLQQSDSWLQAAFRNWKTPVSSEWMALADLIDSFIAANSKKKAKPYKRPWPSEGTQKIGSSRRQSRSEVIKRLETMNPKEENGD